jgi:hypothetical protein
MTKIEALEAHIKELDKELDDIYHKLGYFRKNKHYAEKHDSWKKQAPEE